MSGLRFNDARNELLHHLLGSKLGGAAVKATTAAGSLVGSPQAMILGSSDDVAGPTDVLDLSRPPQLDAPAKTYGQEELLMLLQEWASKITETTATTMQTSIKSRRATMQAAGDKSIKDMSNFFRKCEKQAEKAKAKKIVGWIKSAALMVTAAIGLVAAGASILATGGATTPLAVVTVMATLSLLSGTASFAQQMVEETGGKKFDHWDCFDITSLAAKGVAYGVDKHYQGDEAKKERLKADLLLSTTIISTCFVMGVSGAAAWKAGPTLIANIGKISKLMGLTASFTSGSSMIAQGATNFELAGISRDLGGMRASRKELDAVIRYLAQVNDTTIMMLQEMISQDADRMERVSEIVTDRNKTAGVIVAATGHGPGV